MRPAEIPWKESRTNMAYGCYADVKRACQAHYEIAIVDSNLEGPLFEHTVELTRRVYISSREPEGDTQ